MAGVAGSWFTTSGATNSGKELEMADGALWAPQSLAQPKSINLSTGPESRRFSGCIMKGKGKVLCVCVYVCVCVWTTA